MSTRRYLRDRRKFFLHTLKKDPTNESAKKVVAEIDFLLLKLKEYEQNSSCTKVT